MKSLGWCFSGLILGAALAGSAGAANVPTGYSLLYEQDFSERSALRDFVVSDPAAWDWSQEQKGGALELVRQSKYQPAVRSPFNISLIAARTFEDFVLEADLRQTGKEYGHRDMVIFFGFQDPTHFYYVHLASAADEHAHNIFIVNNAPRTKIARETTKGIQWGGNVWHKVRLERRGSDGTVRVYFDDMNHPIMTAEDKTFPKGHVGFGSFDDTGKIDNVKIWGAASQTNPAGFFRRLK